VYKTINLVNNKFYIGKHRQQNDEFDGYLGSGILVSKAVAKYGRENFIRETIGVFDTENDCYQAESKIIGDLWKERSCYNLAPGGDCGVAETKQEWWNNNPDAKENRKQDWENNNPSKTRAGRQRIQKSNKNRIWSTDAKEKCGLPHRGKPKPRKICPHCDRSIAINLFERYHNDKCKEKK
jgi:hypothetical protein